VDEEKIGRWLRSEDVRRKVGNVGASTLRQWVQDGKFPPPREISKRFKIWYEPDVDEWLASHPHKAVQGAVR
jgi:predicted DNA-binding transcriptional regulator AlpA